MKNEHTFLQFQDEYERYERTYTRKIYSIEKDFGDEILKIDTYYREPNSIWYLQENKEINGVKVLVYSPYHSKKHLSPINPGKEEQENFCTTALCILSNGERKQYFFLKSPIVIYKESFEIGCTELSYDWKKNAFSSPKTVTKVYTPQEYREMKINEFVQEFLGEHESF